MQNSAVKKKPRSDLNESFSMRMFQPATKLKAYNMAKYKRQFPHELFILIETQSLSILIVLLSILNTLNIRRFTC